MLIGDTVNTNASWLGQYLTDHGLEVTRIHTVGDDLDHMISTLSSSLERARLVITTGGLGPTHDDITKKAILELFEVDTVIHEPTLDFIRQVFEKRNIPFSKSNHQQAEVPANAEVLFNRQGTAPGLWIEEKECRLAVLPGVPYEMKKLMEEKVLPRINALGDGKEHRYSRYIVTAGVGESTLSDEVIGTLDRFRGDDITVAYLPSPQGARIRISGYGKSREEAADKIKPVADYIHEKAGDLIIGEGKDLTISEALGKLLRQRGITISVAESCTGGLVANTLTDIPGSSDYMMGGVVAYSNEAKVKLLNVDGEVLRNSGAVSKPVALQMARNAARLFETDIGISTTGIAGPGGGTDEKAVGLVWIGCWTAERHFALKALFTDDRQINKERSTAVALETVRRCILGIPAMPYDLKPDPA